MLTHPHRPSNRRNQFVDGESLGNHRLHSVGKIESSIDWQDQPGHLRFDASDDFCVEIFHLSEVSEHRAYACSGAARDIGGRWCGDAFANQREHCIGDCRPCACGAS